MRQNFRLFMLSLLPAVCLASSGDRSPVFVSCVRRCQADRCSGVDLPLALRLARWSCKDDCEYMCMHEITDRDVSRGVAIQQYHGKWPFWRLGGVQEPASVAFSLMNLWAHAQGAMKIINRIPENHPMKQFYLFWSLTSVNAWLWSSVFHTRDVSITEKLDYFSAASAIMYALYYTVIRLFHLYPTPNSHSRRGVYNFWTLLCAVAFLSHISYLTLLPRFDYTYNIVFNLIIGLAHNALWLIYSLPNSSIRRFPSKPSSYLPPYAWKAAAFVALMTAATALELFDFPPMGRIIDAHALWHLATVPIGLFWYNFLVQDALDSGWKGQRA